MPATMDLALYYPSDGTEVIGLSDLVHQNRSTEVLIGVTASLDVRSYSYYTYHDMLRLTVCVLSFVYVIRILPYQASL
jgi:hypothetical protein